MKIGNYWKQIIAWALCVVITVGLLYVVHDDRKKNATLGSDAFKERLMDYYKNISAVAAYFT